MSLQAAQSVKPRAFAALARLWREGFDAERFKLFLVVFAALGATYVLMGVKTLADGAEGYGYGDFFALWTSALVAHDGQPLLNYDAAALHLKQVALGMNPHGYNPFPYPPPFLLAIAPLGGLSLGAAFWIFIGLTFAAYVLAIAVGGDRWRLAAPFVAPATGITLISGQSGFLSGALMIGGLRLLERRPIVAGVLFGLLTFKPQLGVLIPIALVASGRWRAIASAGATFGVLVVASGLALGWAAWPIWLHSIVDYANGFDIVVNLMPTVYANAEMAHAPRMLALALQLMFTLPVAFVIWRACRDGVGEKAIALMAIGTFLSTPHAFNYDMPMTTAAIAAYLGTRWEASRSLKLYEAAVVAFAFATPFLILGLRASAGPWSWAPMALLFALMARPGAWPPSLSIAEAAAKA